jgi:hypothetical protein
MYSGKYVFSQALKFVDNYEFNKCVKRYFGSYHVRDLSCWNQLVQLFFGQMTSLNSFLSRANEKRDWRIFADCGSYLISKVRPLYADSPIPKLDIDNEVFALDSTTISVSINLCTWAERKYARGAVKMHTLLNLRGHIPEFILIADGKYHDSNALDEITPEVNIIYLMNRAYVDFEALIAKLF